MGEIESGRIKIPQFQRDFVWSKEKSAKLLDSMVKGYPIGTFIFWNTREELRSLRNIGGLDLPPTPEGDYIQYILDGQQRLTSIFAVLKGLTIKREDHEEDFSEFFIDLEAKEEEPIVITEHADKDHHKTIKLHSLMHGKIKEHAAYPEDLQEKIQEYKDRINAYQFSSILIKETPIAVATEIFTRLNVTGKPLSTFEVMVAKTFDSQKGFDLAEKYDELISELEAVDYGTIAPSVILQAVSVILCKQCRKSDILELSKDDVIDIWDEAVESVKYAVDFFRNTFRIPVSRLLPYPNLVVPFSYYFYKNKRKPTGRALKLLNDFFWRASLGGRYSQSVETRLAQDVEKIEKILNNESPKYDWGVDISPKFIENNGWFSVGRAYIKALLCVLSYKEPKSFNDGSIVRISNDWLKQANSRNYHHFFPKAFLKKKGIDDFHINHIANITIVDDFLNKREIRENPPSEYMKKFAKQNDNLDACMKTHLINPQSFGVYDDNFQKFFSKRCRAFSKELRKKIIKHDMGFLQPALPASETQESELE